MRNFTSLQKLRQKTIYSNSHLQPINQRIRFRPKSTTVKPTTTIKPVIESSTTTMKNKKMVPTFYNNRFKTVFFNRYPFPKRRPTVNTDNTLAKPEVKTSTTTTTTTTTTTVPTTTKTTTTTTTTPMTTSTELTMTIKTTKSVQRPKPKLPYQTFRPFFIKLKNTPITTSKPTVLLPTTSPIMIQKQPQEMLELFDARTKIYVTRPPPHQKHTITERPQKFGFKLLSTTIRTPVTTSAVKV